MRRSRVAKLGVFIAILACSFSGAAQAKTIGREPVRTTVSLEFDHAFTDQLPAVQLAAGYGMPVTIFAMSGRLGHAGYMTAAQLRALQAQGAEIGGHTIDHPNLAALPPAAQRHEICGDRAALQADGLVITDFAYPYGDWGPATPGIVRSCGYQSARDAGGLAATQGCAGACPPAETIPPRNPFLTRAADSVLSTTSLATIEGYVTNAERHGGGWVQLIFHYICDGCDPYSVSAQTLSSFLAWLAPRVAVGTRVETVREVINTPFVPGRLRVSLTAGRSLGLRPALRCPSTPVGTRCRRQSLPPARLVSTASTLTMRTRSPAKSLRVELAGRSIRAGGGGERWHVRLPSAGKDELTTVAVSYPLGLAKYRLRLVRP